MQSIKYIYQTEMPFFVTQLLFVAGDQVLPSLNKLNANGSQSCMSYSLHTIPKEIVISRSILSAIGFHIHSHLSINNGKIIIQNIHKSASVTEVPARSLLLFSKQNIHIFSVFISFV